MTAVGLSVSFTDMWRIGWRPLAAGLMVATLVGGCSLLLTRVCCTSSAEAAARGVRRAHATLRGDLHTRRREHGERSTEGFTARGRRARCARCCAGPARIRDREGLRRHAAARGGCLPRLVLRLPDRSGRLPAAHLRGSRRLRRDDRAARHLLRIALRAPHGADHRARAHRLPAGRQGGRHQQAGARRRRLRAALPGAGEAHRADRRLHRPRCSSRAAWAWWSTPCTSA